MRVTLLVWLLVFLCSCSSVTIQPVGVQKLRSAPDFEKRFNYYWWGLKGEHKVNVRLVCQGKSVEQMQAVTRISDSLLTIVTIGIYSPRTARIWCERRGNQDAI